MKTNALKFSAFLILLALWIVLDYFKFNDPTLIDTIRDAIGGLGLWHAISNLQAVPQAAPAQDSTPAQPSRLPTVPLE